MLAAGFSRRFGQQDKLMQPLADQQPIGWHAARSLKQVLPDSVAVVRDADTALSAALNSLGLGLEICPPAAQTMADSLVLGVMAAQRAFPHVCGVVIALADMPWIQASTIQAVADALRAGATIAQPVFKDKPGHPVGFSAELIPELLQVHGDQGARQVLKQYAHAVVQIACNDEGILRDIDTQAQLADYLSGHRLA